MKPKMSNEEYVQFVEKRGELLTALYGLSPQQLIRLRLMLLQAAPGTSMFTCQDADGRSEEIDLLPIKLKIDQILDVC